MSITEVNRRDMDEVIRAFCEVSYTVRDHFSNQYAADCFCTDQNEKSLLRFEYEPRILDFIRAAVAEKIARDGKPASRYPSFELAGCTLCFGDNPECICSEV